MLREACGISIGEQGLVQYLELLAGHVTRGAVIMELLVPVADLAPGEGGLLLQVIQLCGGQTFRTVIAHLGEDKTAGLGKI